ncbi:MAG: hypothetical protein AABX19_02355 [Nanoarchaeota archaeon]
MFNKKAQSMPMNVIIVGIIVLVVLVIIVAFFAGGFTSLGNKFKDIFSGQAGGQALDLAIQTCQSSCESSLNLPSSSQAKSSYCTASYVVDTDSNPSTAPEKVKCGSVSNADLTISPSEEKRGIKKVSDLGVECAVTC